ncbi:MAG: hypothetical protein ACHQK8_01260 [Bacteroidia bacterium]
MKCLYLTVAVFVFAGCSTFTPGNIVFDKVSSQANIVSGNSISVAIRLLSPEEANQALGNRFRQYDYRSGRTTFYKPVEKIQVFVFSILNDRSDSVIFNADETNGYLKNEKIFELIRDNSGDAALTTSLLCGSILTIGGLSMAGNPRYQSSGAPTLVIITGVVYMLCAVPALTNQQEVNNNIQNFLKKISPEKLKVPPHREMQIVVFRQNPAFPQSVFQNEEEEIAVTRPKEIFVNKSEADELKLIFISETKTRIEIKTKWK